MSKLKIPDLSFCETELDNSDQVRGGMSRHLYFPFSFYSGFWLPFRESEMEVIEESLAENGSKRTYFYDEETDSSGVLVSKETDTGKMMSLAAGGTSSNGGRYAVSTSSMLTTS